MESSDLEKLVNRSGFLFQIAVEEHVRSNAELHGWRVVAREYPWSSPSGDRSGYVDFIADRFGLHAVFECKRTQGGEWVFLVPRAAKETRRLRSLWTHVSRSEKRGSGWDDLGFDPASLVSEFCIVRGGSDDDKPMLERIAGDLVRAAESLAREDLEQRSDEGTAGFIPVIVTNAALYACRVDPSEVDLAKGMLPPSASFEPISVIRFRKATATDMKPRSDAYGSLQERLAKKERSAIVINVGHLSNWLGAVNERDDTRIPSPRPWRHLDL